MTRRVMILTFMLAMTLLANSKNMPKSQYQSPVNYTISLAGNFGEPRPNHFHGGTDIKTDRVEGKPIFSIGDGYISHVTIGIGGFGNAVYVHHPQGHTSIYAHLQRFIPQVTALVRKWQYEHHCVEGEIRFRPTDFPVAKGQLLAFSGNTGASQAPHLHLEIHDNKTYNMLDPLGFIGDNIVDHVSPIAHAMMAYPQENQGVFNGSDEAQYFNFTANNVSQELTAWGKVGFGLWANDYMEESTNNFGIRKTEFYVDGHLLFHSDVNDIPVSDNLQVNAWGDYDHYSKSHVWYMRSFLLPGITLPICSADENRGIIDFKEERPYRFTYILSDFKGNKSEYTFTVIGKKTPIHRTKLAHPLHTLVWNRLNNYQLPGLQLQVPSRYLVENAVLTPRVSTKENSFSSSFQLSEKSIALLKHCKLSLQVKKEVKDPSKLYIISHSKTDKFVGGEYKDGWVTAKILDLNAEYELAYDVNAPKIDYEGHNGDVIRFNLTDEESGIKHFEGSIDGHFVLFEKVGRSSFIACKLKGTPVKKIGKKHNLELTVTDNRNNQSNYKTQIIY